MLGKLNIESGTKPTSPFQRICKHSSHVGLIISSLPLPKTSYSLNQAAERWELLVPAEW